MGVTLAVRRDYLSGDVVGVEKYLLSEAGCLFYAKIGVVDVAYEAPAPEIVDGYIVSDVKFGRDLRLWGEYSTNSPMVTVVFGCRQKTRLLEQLSR